MEPDGPSHPRRGGDLCRPTRTGPQPVRAHQPTASNPSLLHFISARRVDQDLPAGPRNVSGTRAPANPTAFVEWALALLRSAEIALRHDRVLLTTPAQFSRETAGVRLLAAASRSPISEGGKRTAPATAANSSAATGDVYYPAAPASRRRPVHSLGAGLDACAAMRSGLVLAPSASVELVPCWATPRICGRRGPDSRLPLLPISTRPLPKSGCHWDGILDAVKVKTPDRSMDIMLNRWLLYQTIACRLWARAAFYQAQRRLWLSRPAARWHGPFGRAPADDARARSARGGAAVRRGRRPLSAAVRHPGQGARTRIAYGWPLPSATLSRRLRRHRHSRRKHSLPGGPGSGAVGA